MRPISWTLCGWRASIPRYGAPRESIRTRPGEGQRRHSNGCVMLCALSLVSGRVGECGLDFHYDHAPRNAQRAVFRTQLELAAELSLPVVVHAREADADVAHMIREYQGRVIGVLHCFSGGRELLEVGLDAGWYISFAGIVTFPSFRGHGLLRTVPRERLLVETDSPFLAPVPHRGKRNEPGYVVRVAEAVARLRGEPIDEVAAYTSTNARRLFGI